MRHILCIDTIALFSNNATTTTTVKNQTQQKIFVFFWINLCHHDDFSIDIPIHWKWSIENTHAIRFWHFAIFVYHKNIQIKSYLESQRKNRWWKRSKSLKNGYKMWLANWVQRKKRQRKVSIVQHFSHFICHFIRLHTSDITVNIQYTFINSFLCVFVCLCFSLTVEDAAAGKLDTVVPPAGHLSSSSSSSDSSSSSSSDSSSSDSSDSEAG